MPERVYAINNRILGQKELLRLCEKVLAISAYKIYQNSQKGLLNQ